MSSLESKINSIDRVNESYYADISSLLNSIKEDNEKKSKAIINVIKVSCAIIIILQIIMCTLYIII